ncbi:MAG TPA: DUF4097 family beta strand repeat-containing protein [Candidatus Kapabacteria bacterium]|nr:DUF4097 family beta strand repeat-containing protein [Candidatus Kapabacteria bacterium]
MKHYTKTIQKYIYLLCVLMLLIMVEQEECSAEKTKKYEKRMSVKPSQSITIANFTHSDIMIKYHDKPEIYYSLTVRIQSSDEDDEIEFIDSVYIRDRISEKEIVVQMIDRAPNNQKSDVKIFGIDFGEEFLKSCKGEIYIPQSAWVNIGIRSTKLTIDDIIQELKIIGESNTIIAKNCKNIKTIVNKNGTTRLYSCNGFPVNLEGKNGTYTAQNIGNIVVNAPYSKIELYDVNGKAEIQSRSGTVRVKNITQGLICRADYTSMNIEKIKNNTSIYTKSATITITEAESVSMDADYATIGIRKVIAADSLHGVEIVSRSSTIRLDDIAAKIDIESPYSTIGVRDIRGNLKFSGKSSTVNGTRVSGNIDIVSDNGGVELRDVKAKNIYTEMYNGKIRYSLMQHPEKISLYAEQGNVALTVPKSFDGELHLSASNDIESNIECLTSAGKVRKFDGKSMTGKKSTVTIRSSILRFDEN